MTTLAPRRLSLLVLVLLLAAAPAGAGDAEAVVARVAVKANGWMRIPAASLETVGLPPPAAVRVTHAGQPVAVIREGGDLLFLALDHQTDHSAWGVYEVSAGTPPPPVARSGSDIDVPTAMTNARRVVATDHVHGTLAAALPEVYAHPGAPTWFLGRIGPNAAWTTDLSPLHAEPGYGQQLEARVFATRRGPVALQAHWGERDLGIARAPSAAGGARITWTVPPDLVPAEGTALVVRDVSPSGPGAPEQDWSDDRGSLWVDELALTGRVRNRIDGGLARFDVAAGDVIRIEVGERRTDDPTVYVAAVDAEGRPVQGATLHPATGALPRWGHWRVEGVPDGTRWIASTHAEPVALVAAARTAHPLATAGQARHVILAVPELLAGAKTLATHRRATGTPSAVVPVADVYAHYGHGEATPGAIRAFLVALMRRPGAPLEYVLLAGDATLDRTDMTPFVTIPAPMARTMYNGATAADRLYARVPEDLNLGGPAIGRLPFRDAATMEAYVARLIRYEKTPPPDPTRRLLRFVTNEGRFGVFIDRLLEGMFRTIISSHVPAAFDIEITFASPKSPLMWPPPEFDDKIIEGINEGCLFYTYVGHGYAKGFDRLRVGDRLFPVLDVDRADRVACRGTPPALFVIACTTAIFDQPSYMGIGETLLARPEGPIAYWGATRICHPAANTLLGRAITQHIANREGEWRLGDILSRARDEVIAPPPGDRMRGMIDMATRMLAKGADPKRLAVEGTWMYTLLGDPAVRLAFPVSDLAVAAAATPERDLHVEVTAPLPDGTVVHLSVEVPRDQPLHRPTPVADPLDEASYEQIRSNHALANDLALVRATGTVADGRVVWRVRLPEADAPHLVVKAWAQTSTQVHQGAAEVTVPPPPGD